MQNSAAWSDVNDLAQRLARAREHVRRAATARVGSASRLRTLKRSLKRNLAAATAAASAGAAGADARGVDADGGGGDGSSALSGVVPAEAASSNVPLPRRAPPVPPQSTEDHIPSVQYLVQATDELDKAMGLCARVRTRIASHPSRTSAGPKELACQSCDPAPQAYHLFRFWALLAVKNLVGELALKDAMQSTLERR